MLEKNAVTYLPFEQIDREPLQLVERLTLIKLADDLGYSVKIAKEMRSVYDAISTDLYAVWFAIENDLPIYASNIPDLIEHTGWERSRLSLSEESFDMCVAS